MVELCNLALNLAAASALLCLAVNLQNITVIDPPPPQRKKTKQNPSVVNKYSSSSKEERFILSMEYSDV